MISAVASPERHRATSRKLADEFLWLSRASIAPRVRTMREFAESEIIIPDGPHRGRRFQSDTQPYAGLFFDAIDSGIWNRFAATGPSQTGKTLSCVVIPVMYHLFEIGETVICGVPHMNMAHDKWRQDFEPAIKASRYADLLPSRGKGSRGGQFDAIAFRNGATLRFMTGGGDDKTRAGFTARVIAVTEVDGLDETSELSREADPIKQLEARTRAYGNRKRVYLECTVSIETGRIWQEYTNGTASRLMLPCPHCGSWVQPERDSFVGWADAATEIQAEQLAGFFCPKCAEKWTDAERRKSNLAAVLVHGHQTVVDGEPVGDLPETHTLGFRWSAVNNMFATSEQLGGEEWRAARELDVENAQKERQQFVWCEPWDGQITDIDISEKLIAARLTGLERGVLPDDTESLVVHIDLHNRLHYWTLLATSPGRVRSIVDYGLWHTPNPDVNGPEVAIHLGLEQLAEHFRDREWKTVSGTKREIDLHLIDAGYQQDVGLRFVTEMGSRWMLHKGQGETEYKPPNKDDIAKNPKLRQEWFVGHHWARHKQDRSECSNNRPWWLYMAPKSLWMRVVHGGFAMDPFVDGERRPGSLALFGSDPAVHLTPIDRTVSRSAYAVQLMAWKWEESVTVKRGQVMQWQSQHKDDHWFDTTYGALVAAAVFEAEREITERRPAFRVPADRRGRR